MTAGYPDATERVLALLPAHVRNRDDASGGLLRALIEAVAAELTVLEADLDELYDSWFAETCPEWVVPYLADLLGVASLPPDVSDAGVSRRAFVANTVAYRRRKGTPAAAEQVARDATGWPARAVEYYRLLAAATHTQHVRLTPDGRPDRPATVSLRTLPADGGPLELIPRAAAQGALDPVAHTAEVRRIASGAGRYGIGNLGVFVFPDLVSETGWAPPVAAEGGGWAVHPLGYATPLYAPPAAETTIEHLAAEADLPVPLRPRRLLALLAAARAAAAKVSDPGSLAAIRAAPEVYRWWRGGEDLAAAVEEDLDEPGSRSLAIEHGGRVVGAIQWSAEEEPDYRHASIDVYVDAALHGRGLGTDAVRTLVRHLVAEHGHHRITIDPAVDNPAAIRSYTKAGFRPVGVMRQSERGPDGTWHDALLMDLLAEDLAD